MHELDLDDVPVGLAECEAELEEWDRLRVRDYWDAVVAEELGAPQLPASPYAWSEMGSGERVRLRRYRRRTDNTVVRLVTAAAHVPTAPPDSEAA